MTAPISQRVPEYLDFDLEIGPGRGRQYPVAILQSPVGEARATMRFPFTTPALAARLSALQLTLLRAATRSRRLVTSDEQSVQAFGQALMDALLTEPLRTSYVQSLAAATAQGKRLRLRLRVQAHDLAALPWEFLFDQRRGEYTALTRSVSIVRYLELPAPAAPLTVTLPLRILALVASPSNLPQLDVSNEKQRVETATAPLQRDGLVETTWLEGGTWRDLQRAMRGGPWHIVHFIGHGGFDARSDAGILALADDEGKAQLLNASQVGRLLADHPSLRLVLLNACEGARGGAQDLFSSTAATLVQRGIPAVVAMQFEITDEAAIEFSRSLYEALADGMPVDAAVAEARIGVSLALPNTLEWGTPVLFMRSDDGLLFTPVGKAERSTSQSPRSEITGRLSADPAVAAPLQAPATPLIAGVTADLVSPQEHSGAAPAANREATSSPQGQQPTGRALPSQPSRRRWPPLAVLAVTIAAVALVGVALVAATLSRRGSHAGPAAVALGSATPVAVPPSAVPGSPTAVAASPSPGLLTDDFTDPGKALLPHAASYSQLPGFSLDYRLGEYVVRNTSATRGKMPLISVASAGTYQDGAIAVDARLVGEVTDRNIILSCRGHYLFIVAPATSQFTLVRRDAGDGSLQIPIIDWKSSSLITPGNATNRLALRCVGSRIAAAINDTEVAAVEDHTFDTDTNTTCPCRAMTVGGRVRTDDSSNLEVRFRNLVVAEKAAVTRLATDPGWSSPAWAADLRMPVRSPALPGVSGLRVYDNLTSRHEHSFILGDKFVACFTLTGGSAVQPLSVVAVDAAGPAPTSTNDAHIVARAPAIPAATGSYCPEVVVAKRLPALHVYRVDILAGDTSIANTSFVNEPQPDEVLLRDNYLDPAKRLLPEGEVAGMHGSSRGYSGDEYIFHPASPTTATACPCLQVATFERYADAAVSVDMHIGGDTSDNRFFTLGCRGGRYVLYVYPAAGLFTLARLDSADPVRTVPLVPPQASAAIALGNATNRLVLRCEGTTISAMANGVNIASVDDTAPEDSFIPNQGSVTLGVGCACNAQDIEVHVANLLVVR